MTRWRRRSWRASEREREKERARERERELEEERKRSRRRRTPRGRLFYSEASTDTWRRTRPRAHSSIYPSVYNTRRRTRPRLEASGSETEREREVVRAEKPARPAAVNIPVCCSYTALRAWRRRRCCCG